MGFFAKLFRLILPPDDELEKSISRRIVELRAESQDSAAELDNRRLPDIDLSWYKITLPPDFVDFCKLKFCVLIIN